MKIILAFLVLLPVVHADEANLAKTHYEHATAHFAIGEFDEAAKDYEAAYKLHPDGALLFDAAQAHRLAGHHEKALVMYRNYLIMYPDGASASMAREQVVKLTAAVAADEKAKTPQAPETQVPSRQATDQKPGPVTFANPEPAQRPAAVTSNHNDRTERTPVYKKWWLWTAIGGAVVVGAVVAVAVIETRPTNSFSNVPNIGPGVSSLVTLRLGAVR